jgi:hypothetical protein
MLEVCNSSFLYLELFDATAHFWKTEHFIDFFKVWLIIKNVTCVRKIVLNAQKLKCYRSANRFAR